MTTKKQTLTHCAIILVVALVINLYGVNSRILSQTEPYRVLVAAEMMHNSNYWLTTLNGRLYLAKPPVFPWMICITSLFSPDVTPVSARLASVLSAVALGLVLYLLARRWIGARAALLSSLICLTAGEMLMKSPVAEIDVNFTLWVAVALLYFFRACERPDKTSSWLLSYIFLGIATLTKGPPSLMFYFGTIVPYLLIKKQSRLMIKPMNLAGFGLFILIVAAWVFPVINSVGWDKFSAVLAGETVHRTFRYSFNMKWIFFYPVKLLAGFIPWTPLVFLFFSKSRFKGDDTKNKFMLFCIINVLAALILFSISPGRALRYILPVFPFLSCIAAVVLDEIIDRKASVASTVYVRFVFTIIIILIAIGVLFLPHGDSLTGLVFLVVFILVTAVTGAVMCVKKNALWLFTAVLVTVFILKVAYTHWYIPEYNHKRNYVERAEVINKFTEPGKPMFAIEFNRPGLFYYVDVPVVLAGSIEELANEATRRGSIRVMATTGELVKLKQRFNRVRELQDIHYRKYRILIVELYKRDKAGG
jgi:4-amino-4-deoxy-L-arabinose transferase-like glycosyltransferase